ncbi:MAG: tRNA lysidine(34) synthetase TilS [Desulfosarcinaceae bacterium]|nr:tRNA lysidine(34) synthetase TilS [Desulfosarcinaceae bacterium]
MPPSANTTEDPKRERHKTRFENRVVATIDTYGLLSDKDIVLVAVSGGPDSVALLQVLLRLRNLYRITLQIAHLNHGLRAGAAEDQAFVESVANNLGLPFHADRRDVDAYRHAKGLSLEEAARQVRYTFLRAVADKRNCTKIAVGHQADDSAELVLMNLLRGSGPQGLSGIPPRNGRIIRPLIDIHRDWIEAYVDAHRLTYRQDVSNADMAFTRNRVRHELIPYLEKRYNPRLRQLLHRTGHIFRDEGVWIENQIHSAYPGLGPERCAEGVRFRRARLRSAPAAVQRRVLRWGLAMIAGDLKRLRFSHIEQIRRLAQMSEAGLKWLDLPRGIRVMTDLEWIVLKLETAEERRIRRDGGEPDQFRPFRYEVACPQDDPIVVSLPDIDAQLTLQCDIHGNDAGPDPPQRARFDVDRLKFPLVLRSTLPGDRLQPLGMTGRKKVSDLLIDCKIPISMRHRHPVLISGGRIVWLVGVRMAADARIRADTRRLLIGEFCLLK